MILKKLTLFCFIITLLSCLDIEPRKPLNKKNITFFQSSIERNKKIKKYQEILFKSIINKSSEDFFYSSYGFWYTFKVKNQSVEKPNSGDQVIFSYQIEDVNGKIIYTESSLGTVTYRVDKEDLLPALREGVKVLKKGEIASFLFPSYLCHGYMGDGEKIGINQPLKITINLLEHIK
tara:strand:- start:1180 stop:1710 length:531 start_codon:yes stop_codon:yes gene_type:complete